MFRPSLRSRSYVNGRGITRSRDDALLSGRNLMKTCELTFHELGGRPEARPVPLLTSRRMLLDVNSSLRGTHFNLVGFGGFLDRSFANR